ncbi:MAG: Txe/YoeB family addiction module toxin [Chromatiales bacterium]|nr:Txe/YoeB family addiction module toxin [Chromatiales bacterium]
MPGRGPRSGRGVLDRAPRCAEATIRDPFDGPGKPERLRGELAGCWSRRIDHEHRLVYMVDDDRVHFLAARHHYGE